MNNDCRIDVGDELDKTSEQHGGNAKYILTSEGRHVDVASPSMVILHRDYLPMSTVRWLMRPGIRPINGMTSHHQTHVCPFCC